MSLCSSVTFLNKVAVLPSFLGLPFIATIFIQSSPFHAIGPSSLQAMT